MRKKSKTRLARRRATARVRIPNDVLKLHEVATCALIAVGDELAKDDFGGEVGVQVAREAAALVRALMTTMAARSRARRLAAS